MRTSSTRRLVAGHAVVATLRDAGEVNASARRCSNTTRYRLRPDAAPGSLHGRDDRGGREGAAGFAIQQNITALENRVNALGVAETVVQRQGQNRIAVQVPGVQDASEVVRLFGKVATLNSAS